MLKMATPYNDYQIQKEISRMEQYLNVMRDAVEMMAGRMQSKPEESPQKLFNEYEHKFFQSLGRIYAIRPDVRTRLLYTVKDPIKKDAGMAEDLEMYFDVLFNTGRYPEITESLRKVSNLIAQHSSDENVLEIADELFRISELSIP